MRVASEPFWTTGATVMGDTIFEWVGRATSGEAARDECLASAKRAWGAFTTIAQGRQAVPVVPRQEAREDFSRSRTYLRVYGARQLLGGHDVAEATPTLEEASAAIEAAARVEIVLLGLPRDLCEVTLTAGSGTHLGPNSLIPKAHGTTLSGRRVDVALSTEARAVLELACVCHMAHEVAASQTRAEPTHHVRLSQSRTLQAAVMGCARRTFRDDCKALSDFARRLSDDGTAEAYKAQAAFRWAQDAA